MTGDEIDDLIASMEALFAEVRKWRMEELFTPGILKCEQAIKDYRHG